VVLTFDQATIRSKLERLSRSHPASVMPPDLVGAVDQRGDMNVQADLQKALADEKKRD
jgi:hypothetical protein